MASELRKRTTAKGKGHNVPSEPVTPVRDQSPIKANDKIKIVRPKHKRKFGAIFLLGSLFGIIAAGFFAKSNDLIDFPEIGELSVDSWLDVLPAGLVKDVRDLVVRICAAASLMSAFGIYLLTKMALDRKESVTSSTPMTPSRLVSRLEPRALKPSTR